MIEKMATPAMKQASNQYLRDNEIAKQWKRDNAKKWRQSQEKLAKRKEKFAKKQAKIEARVAKKSESKTKQTVNLVKGSIVARLNELFAKDTTGLVDVRRAEQITKNNSKLVAEIARKYSYEPIVKNMSKSVTAYKHPKYKKAKTLD